MRRSILILTLFSAAGCLYERGAVREDPDVYAPAPAPAPPAADYTAPSYQSETPPPAAGSEVASEDVFYNRLSPYGYWTWVEGYGRVWVPAVGYGWRPYYYGQWVLTDWGWTFVSDDPWGWAAYHYGRWNWGLGVGWYWIPGRVWGPAWVSWRYGGGYVSWCPLGPRGVVFGYGHPAWVAVGQTHFTQPIARVAVPVRQTAGVVAAAQPLAGPHATVARGGSFGPPVADVQRATGQAIRPVAAGAVVARSRPVVTGVAPGARAAASPMRSPVQPRARTGSGGDVSRPVGRPGGVAPGPRSYGGGYGPGSRARGGGEARAPASGPARSAPAPSGSKGVGPHAHGGGQTK